MRLRKYSYLFLLMMFCLCITACGNSASSSGNKVDDLLPTVVTTDFSSNFEDTYWVNKDANIGYYFKDGYITSITFGEKETAKYTISASEITANGDSISYQLLGDTLVLTLDGISLNFTKSTKDDFNALSPDSSGNASRLINSYWITEQEYAVYHFTADKMTVAVFGSEIPFLCVIDDEKIVAGAVTYTYTFTDTGLTLYSDEESTIKLLPSTKEVFESYVNKSESETTAGSKTDYIGMTIEDFADTGVEITDYMDKKKYYNYKQKLFDRYTNVGHYVFDLAVQRYIIENDLKQNNGEEKIDKIKYYLAVLNHEYIFDGTYENGEPVYNTDINGNDIVTYFDLTSVTKDYLDKIDIIRKNLEMYIQNLKVDVFPLGQYCEHKKTTSCKFKKICWNHIPEYNSIFNYIDSHHGFKDENGNKYELFDLVNSGMINMSDVPDNYLNRKKNSIQKEVLLSGVPYINEQKIIDGIRKITYPIYHLDFETFPCPLPRYKGEKCYSQSVFQFSLHIEKEPNVCDKEKDHYEFLAYDHSDLREELVKKMCDYIDTESGGIVLVYNELFEKTRLKELSIIFPEYKEKLLKIRDMVFDLMNITKTKSELYEQLGYNKLEAKMFNYYHKNQSGSYSIKKFLPLFSDLTYKGMEI